MLNTWDLRAGSNDVLIVNQTHKKVQKNAYLAWHRHTHTVCKSSGGNPFGQGTKRLAVIFVSDFGLRSPGIVWKIVVDHSTSGSNRIFGRWRTAQQCRMDGRVYSVDLNHYTSFLFQILDCEVLVSYGRLL